MEDLLQQTQEYTDDKIVHLEWNEHIRRRPGMYIGKLGDGQSADDGIYVLLKETIDNSIDEFMMGYGKKIEVSIQDSRVVVRDYGRGIPLGKVVDVASQMNTGAKYDSSVFKKSVGLNGVGIKAVNALSTNFMIRSFRDGQCKRVVFSKGVCLEDDPICASNEKNGTETSFIPDKELFVNYNFLDDYIVPMLKNYTYLNRGLTIVYNGEQYQSKNGLLDLLNENMSTEGIYPIIHLVGQDVEIAMTHNNKFSEEYYSFVNGQHTTQGGTHLMAFREALIKTVRDFYKKEFDVNDIKASIAAAVSIKVEEPVFESQTKTKLGSKNMSPNGESIRNFMMNFVTRELDNYLHKNPETAQILLKKIQDNERDRKAISGIQKIARERAKKVNLHNRKLRDCNVHFNSSDKRKSESTIFITEGDSASGSITKSRDVNTQAVFSLRGKPLNCFGLTKKVVYENEEFNLLQAALDIEEGIDSLRYNKVIVATDADVDGMHIRLLIITFFLQFFPELIKKGHVYVLQTPLFRVRNRRTKIKNKQVIAEADAKQQASNAKKSDFITHYCYSDEERLKAIQELGPDPEITRFKGLGEISPEEFVHFIGPDMRLEQVTLHKNDQVQKLLEYYMGKNTPERQNFIIDNLVIEEDLPEDEEEENE
ncbi:MAG: type IIA DNA topoisomerase subunit B [Bacteroidales bacterium]|nr:type IIA DNA topoisomerase subunit B [Bacteroidales bacterium]